MMMMMVMRKRRRMNDEDDDGDDDDDDDDDDADAGDNDDDVDDEEEDDPEEPLINYDEDFDDDDDYANQSYFENNQFVSIYPEASEIDRFANTIIQEDFHWDLGLQMKTLEMGASYPSLKRENKFCMECRCPLRKHNYHWIEKKGLSTLRLLCEKEEN